MANRVEARVVRIVDGDTLLCEMRVRLRDRNSPELPTPEGIAAAHATQEEFPVHSRIVLRIIAADSYGRLLATAKRGGL